MADFRYRVLVIDDDDGVRKSLGRLLAERHEIDTAPGAASARALLAANTYDVVLCDVMMPDETGVDLLGSLDAEAAERVVFMTGGVLGADLQDRLQQTGRPVLLKPLSVAVIDAAIHDTVTALGRR